MFVQLVVGTKIVYEELVEEDIDIYTQQDDEASKYSYALDRLNQRRLPLDRKRYTGKLSGKGITVYVVDTGIIDNSYYSFECGYNFIDNNKDCSTTNIHGTHVGSLIKSKRFGFAHNSRLINLKVLNDGGSGRLSTVVRAIDYIISQNISCSIVNLSLGGIKSKIFNRKIKELTNAGHRVVVAAGNYASDACKYSPASAKTAITVGSIDIDDTQSRFTNTGKCVDFYAPGSGIIGATGRNNFRKLSGTSMSTPLTSGILALYMERNGCKARIRRTRLGYKFKIPFKK